jgi:prephenate dehydrogenase
MIKALQAMGFRVTVSSIEEHDKAMAAMQVMHHYAYLVMALELEKAIRTDQRMVNFLTRSLRKTVNQLRSFRKINKTLLAIQNLNPYAPRARQAYARRAFEMMDLKPEAVSRIAAAMRGLERLTKLKDSRQMQS